MNREECIIVLGRLVAAFPNVTADDALIMAWVEELDGIPYEDGLDVAKTIIRSDQWFPSISRFIETWRVGRKTHRFTNPYGVLGAEHLYPKLSPEELAEHIDGVKSDLASHPMKMPEPLPGQPARPIGPPPPMCDQDNHTWCVADDQQRRRMDPDRWQRERDEAKQRWHSHPRSA